VDLRLTRRRALITGGSRGIGLAIGRCLAAEGATVTLVARDAVAVERQAALLRSETGTTVFGLSADTGDGDSVTTMVAAALDRMGGVDILVNNAATTNPGAIPDDRLEEEINVKVRGYLRCARAVAPGMVERGWGRIINVAGLAARQTGSVTGSIRNVAVAALTKNLADELGPAGVNVTVVHPGPTRTDTLTAALRERARVEGVRPEDIEQRFADATTTGRLVDPEDVAAVVTFLASPLSVALNGDAVLATGGVRGPIHY
jgi:NAD(P)-dependent dehydrogenase (short-subunit alcohol dehydrogenase family)